MKKKLLFPIILISALSVKAQITITSADVSVVGQSYFLATDTTVTSFGNAGANQTWNFSSWMNQELDTLSYVNPSAAAGASNFSGANLAYVYGTGGDNGTFYNNTSTALNNLGYYESDGGTNEFLVKNAPAKKELTFPSTYQTAFTGTAKFSSQFYIGFQGLDSLGIRATNHYSSIIDGWGTITTPAVSNLASLRQKYTEIETDSTFIKPTGQPWMFAPATQTSPNPTFDTIITYTWWTNSKKYPVAGLETDASGNVANASYLLSTAVGINKLVMPNISVFPNPASDNINITGVTDEAYLIILDENGKLVGKSMLMKNKNVVNTSAYGSGIYFYQIVSKSGGTPIIKGKFVVSK